MKSNSPMLQRLSTLLVLGLSCVIASAETSDDEPKVSLKINLVSWGEDLPGLKIKAKGRGKETTALGFRYSKAIKYSGPQTLEISQTEGAKLPDPPEREFDPRFDKPRPKKAIKENKPIDRSKTPKEILARREKNPELIALAKLPLNSRQVTVLLAPGSGGTYQTYVIDDDPRHLPKGTLRIYNLSQEKVALICNKTIKKQLSYGDSMMVRPKKKQFVVYKLAYLDKNGKWKMQETNLINVRADDQVQFLILQSNASFFTASTGSRSGFLQCVELRRSPQDDIEPTDT